MIDSKTLSAASSLTPPDEAEKDLWQKCHETQSGQISWVPRRLYEAYDRQQMGRRGLVSVFGEWTPTAEDILLVLEENERRKHTIC